MMFCLGRLGPRERWAVAWLLSFSVALCLVPSAALADWPVYGHDLANSRDAGRSGPSPGQVASLHQAWAFKSSHGDFTGTPVVAGGVLVAGTNLGMVYALDAATGKLRWSRDVGAPVNGSAAIDLASPGGPTAFIPVAQVGSPHLLALSLTTGAVRWERTLTRQSGSDVFGSPTCWRGTVYLGTSGPGNDESRARGSVVALNERTGRLRWRTFTVPRGHDGGGVWSTPAIDPGTGRLYIGTGNAYHSPAASTTDSMVVLSARSGRILGHFQSTPGDAWELDRPGGGPDYDFGSSPNLITGPGGRQLVGEGQKSGTYWTLSRRTMLPAWHTVAGPGSQADGGISSTAYDGTRIYGSDSIDSQVFALGLGGSILWNSFDTGTAHFSPVAMGNGVVYSTDSGGVLIARDAATGRVITRIPVGGPTFGGISIDRRDVYVALGTGPVSPATPLPSSTTAQTDGSGSIIALEGTSWSGPARSRPPRDANTFSGSCQLTGSVVFQPPLTNNPHSVRQHPRATGTCSGTFADGRGHSHRLASAPVSFHAVELARNATCGGGTDSGSGVVALPYGEIRFSISETRAGPVVTATAQGTQGGSAAAEANVSPRDNPVSVLKACGGKGLARAPIDIRLHTTPSISG